VYNAERRGKRGTYSRSSLPGELEFLAADRILSRESRDALDRARARAIYAPRRLGRHVARAHYTYTM